MAESQLHPCPGRKAQVGQGDRHLYGITALGSGRRNSDSGISYGNWAGLAVLVPHGLHTAFGIEGKNGEFHDPRDRPGPGRIDVELHRVGAVETGLIVRPDIRDYVLVGHIRSHVQVVVIVLHVESGIEHLLPLVDPLDAPGRNVHVLVHQIASQAPPFSEIAVNNNRHSNARGYCALLGGS